MSLCISEVSEVRLLAGLVGVSSGCGSTSAASFGPHWLRFRGKNLRANYMHPYLDIVSSSISSILESLYEVGGSSEDSEIVRTVSQVS